MGRLTHPLLTCTAKLAGDNPLGPLELKVREILAVAAHAGLKRAAVHVADLETCASFDIGPTERFHPASMLKLTPALAWLRRAAVDGQVLKQRLTDDLPPGLETKDDKNLPSALTNGQSYEVADLLRRMLVDSRDDALLLLKRDQSAAERDAIWQDLGVPLARAVGAPALKRELPMETQRARWRHGADAQGAVDRERRARHTHCTGQVPRAGRERPS